MRNILIYEPHRKKGIQIPEKVDVKLNDSILTVKGPLGEMARPMQDSIDVKIEDKLITVSLRKGALNKAVWGHMLLI